MGAIVEFKAVIDLATQYGLDASAFITTVRAVAMPNDHTDQERGHGVPTHTRTPSARPEPAERGLGVPALGSPRCEQTYWWLRAYDTQHDEHTH